MNRCGARNRTMSFTRSILIPNCVLHRSILPRRDRSILRTPRQPRCQPPHRPRIKTKAISPHKITQLEPSQDQSSSNGVVSLFNKVWRWLKVVIPLTLFAIGVSLFKSQFLQDTGQNWIRSGNFASTSMKIAPQSFTWADVVRYRFQKV